MFSPDKMSYNVRLVWNKIQFPVQFVGYVLLAKLLIWDLTLSVRLAPLQPPVELGTARFDCASDKDCVAWNCQFWGQKSQDRIFFELMGGTVLSTPERACIPYTETSACVCIAPSSLFGPGHFYVEIGGHDGMVLSNTRFFDEEMHWKGMLVEGNPETYPTMKRNRPDAISVHALIDGSDDAPSSLPYYSFKTKSWHAMMSGMGGSSPENSKWMPLWLESIFYAEGVLKTEATAQAYADANEGVELVVSNVPVSSFTKEFAEHNVRHVDVFSLDVEGHEASVLKTIDLSLVGLIVVEDLGCTSECYSQLYDSGFLLIDRFVQMKLDLWFVNCQQVKPATFQLLCE